jgi:hypothetical protein
LSPTRESSVGSGDEAARTETEVFSDEEGGAGEELPFKGAPVMPVSNYPSAHFSNETTPLLAAALVPKRDLTGRAAALHELKVLLAYSVP